MFGKKKQPPTRKGGGGEALLRQMGFQDIEADLYGDVENDSELEAELAALQAEVADPSTTQHTPTHRQGLGHQAGVAAVTQLDSIVASCLKDDDGNDSDTDLDDPSLLAELNDLASDNTPAMSAPQAAWSPVAPFKAQSPVAPPVARSPVAPPRAWSPVAPPATASTLTTLESRLSLYKEALQAATTSHDASKQKRLQRGIKTLEGMLKQVKAGKSVNEEDIPPEVAVSSKSPQHTSEVSPSNVSHASPAALAPTLPASVAPTTPTATPTATVTTAHGAIPKQLSPGTGLKRSMSPNKSREMLVTRQEQYKTAAMQAKAAGDLKTATNYLGVSKQFQKVIEAMDDDKPVDLSRVPGPPPGVIETVRGPGPSPRPTQVRAQTRPSDADIDDLPETTEEDKKRLYKAPAQPATVLDALVQRLEKYKATAQQAKEDGESSKARRMTRMVKQYETAIKDVKAGRNVDFDELPVPPGFPPIPQPSPTKSPATFAAPKPTPSPTPAATPAPSTVHPAVSAQPPGGKRTTPTRPDSKRQSGNRAQHQLTFLRERQVQFKQAALKAKKNGDVELAKKYLRQSKGFDQMIEAAESGLPVDMSQVPSLSDSSDMEGFVIVSPQECDGESSDTYTRLQQELIQQIKTATANAEHFTQLGDVSSATKFDRLCLSTRKDLDAVKNAMKHGDAVPRFHYETKHFSLVQCCTELGDNDLEVTIVRGINYSAPQGYSPSDMQTYVKYEFPFPTDDPQKGASEYGKSSNPEYNQTFKLQINRKSRAFLRVVKLKAVKLEVYYKRGFFKGDKVLGTVTVKLQPLENVCVLHDSYNLSEGKKAVGGMLELKIRVRDPLLAKQVEDVKEKWLIIDSFDRVTAPVGRNDNNHTVPAPHSYTSMEVLKYERQLLDQRVQKLKGKLTKSEELTMQQKSKLLAKQVEDTRRELTEGGIKVVTAYMEAIKRTKAVYQTEAKAMVAQGNRDKAQILLNKKNLVEREIAAMQQKLPK